MAYKTLERTQNPRPRPSFWRDPLGWLKWKPTGVFSFGESVFTADWNQMIMSGEVEHKVRKKPACDS